jgi:hypothetical protein
MSALAATTSRARTKTSGRWARAAAGTAGTAIAAGSGRRAAAAASAPRRSGSAMPVSATSALTSRSQRSPCCLAMRSPCAALARVNAALARDSKPLCMLSSVKRAVSARDAASRRTCASSDSQARRATYWFAVSAATTTRASCHDASAP